MKSAAYSNTPGALLNFVWETVVLFHLAEALDAGGSVPTLMRDIGRSCHDAAMGARAGWSSGRVLIGFAWVAVTASVATAVWSARRLEQLGRGDLLPLSAAYWVLVLGIVSALVVGSALAWRRPDHPVGWLFLALSASIAAAGAIDGYAAVGAVADPGSLPGADAAAHIGDATWIPWFVFVALVLHLTPTGRPLSRRWRWCAELTVAAGVVAFVCTVLSDLPVDPPFEDVPNPLAIDAINPVVNIGRAIGATLTGLGLLVAGASLIVRFRRARGDERLRLRWLVVAAVPLGLFVPAAFLAAITDHPSLVLVATGGFVVVVPVAAGLSIARYHLYDVDRILSRSVTYALLTTVVVLTYVAVVVAAGRVLSGESGSQAAAALATVAAISVAAPMRRRIQDRLDRRFNRRRFDALRVVRRHVADPASDRSTESVLREAVGDPSLAVSYWVDDRRQWVTASGAKTDPGASAVEVRRDDRPVARIEFDADRADVALVDVAARAAITDLDNTRLRAAIALQLTEVNESRARIASAHLDERRRIERNLHDGAQQRLLGLAFDLQAARVNGDPERLRQAVDRGVDQAHEAVLELRALANGLCPAVLDDGGLAAALDDLSTRTPVPLDIRCPDTRFPAPVEETAWFVLCESITNAVKHADPSSICVEVTAEPDAVRFSVRDDGAGGADLTGQGLQGIRDRAEALGGALTVAPGVHHGTDVRGWLPCEP